ncbi:Uncharacterized protein Adt_23741 [Abeliophyllum distichum]|uniref:Uncharacterized protein n=1 Tax=Abeliophyllum distichum TaxID=126358 RepID=A0ABD1SC19_9LAMI
MNILFDITFDQMDVDYTLTAISEPLFGFMGDSLVPQGKIILAVDFEEHSRHLRKFMEFFVFNNRSAYHGVLGRLALKDLQAMTPIYHLVMKFPDARRGRQDSQQSDGGKGLLYERITKRQ